MSIPDTEAEPRPRRLMHRRAIDCSGYLRDDGLWEVEARLVDTKTFLQRDQFRGDVPPGEPGHFTLTFQGKFTRFQNFMPEAYAAGVLR